MRKDYTVGLNITETAVDSPNILCSANCMYSATRQLYPDTAIPQVDKLVDQQWMESNPVQREKAGVGDGKRNW